ncbi:MAG TPA: hypothetical protein VJJ22_03515 [Candidatus Paceibacterota bacterium]
MQKYMQEYVGRYIAILDGNSIHVGKRADEMIGTGEWKLQGHAQGTGGASIIVTLVPKEVSG